MKRILTAVMILMLSMTGSGVVANTVHQHDEAVVYEQDGTEVVKKKENHDIINWDRDDDCGVCSGTGKCQTCLGDGDRKCTAYGCNGGSCLACNSGYTYNYSGKKTRCSTCGGDDRCNKCGGDSYVDCTSCTGGRCRSCGGDGKR